MSETPSSGAERPAETAETKTAPSDGEMTRAERIFVRINIAQTILALAGLFTGAVALYAALVESEAVRKQSAAAVWPYVQLLTWDSLDTGEEVFRLSMTNAGVGPARIETMRLRLKGEAAVTWDEALPALVEGPPPRFGRMSVVGRVMRPGESVDMMSTSDPRLVRALHDIVVQGEGSLEYCYCSIFDDCWLADIRSEIAQPTAIDECPSFGEESFRN